MKKQEQPSNTWEAPLLLVVVSVLVVIVWLAARALGDSRPEPEPREVIRALVLSTPVARTPGDTETDDERRERLVSVADDALDAGKGVRTALLLLAVADHEGGFNQTVDRGPCWRGADGRGPQCDSGKAACLLQIHGGSAERNEELFRDRAKCFREGLGHLAASRSVCGQSEPRWQFAAYASGSCTSDSGRKGSTELYDRWQRWQSRYDAEVARRRAAR